MEVPQQTEFVVIDQVMFPHLSDAETQQVLQYVEDHSELDRAIEDAYRQVPIYRRKPLSWGGAKVYAHYGSGTPGEGFRHLNDPVNAAWHQPVRSQPPIARAIHRGGDCSRRHTSHWLQTSFFPSAGMSPLLIRLHPIDLQQGFEA